MMNNNLVAQDDDDASKGRLEKSEKKGKNQ